MTLLDAHSLCTTYFSCIEISKPFLLYCTCSTCFSCIWGKHFIYCPQFSCFWCALAVLLPIQLINDSLLRFSCQCSVPHTGCRLYTIHYNYNRSESFTVPIQQFLCMAIHVIFCLILAPFLSLSTSCHLLPLPWGNQEIDTVEKDK